MITTVPLTVFYYLYLVQLLFIGRTTTLMSECPHVAMSCSKAFQVTQDIACPRASQFGKLACDLGLARMGKHQTEAS